KLTLIDEKVRDFKPCKLFTNRDELLVRRRSSERAHEQVERSKGREERQVGFREEPARTHAVRARNVLRRRQPDQRRRKIRVRHRTKAETLAQPHEALGCEQVQMTREMIAAPGRPAEPATIVASQVGRRDRDQASRPNGTADLLQSTIELPEVFDQLVHDDNVTARRQRAVFQETLYALD